MGAQSRHPEVEKLALALIMLAKKLGQQEHGQCSSIASTCVTVASDVLPKQWSLFVDGSSNRNGSGVGLPFITHDCTEFEYYPRLKFSAFNNKAEYQVLLVELRFALELGAKHLQAYSDL